ncbi:MAG: M6 family metalloprotease domain-containing protein [Candidatus Eisenbacteria bacterium]|nr:M6 family metalloprotease domain-containing protein [Candidatus Eisenbacteria bacterium]
MGAKTAKNIFILLLTSVVLTWPASSHAVPLRPDVLEKLKRDGVAFPSGKQLKTLGVDVPFEKISQNLLRPHGAGREGQVQIKALVILVEFSDAPAEKAAHGVSHYEHLLFGEGLGATRSQRAFFLENSYGKLDVAGDVYGWYTLPNTRAYYGNASYGLCSSCFPRNARGLVEDALILASADVDFSLYDNDGPDGIPSSGDDDGYIDALYVVHSGPGYEDTGSPDDIVSHQWMLAVPFSVGGVSAYVYSMEAESSPVGTFCHELGHVLGLPDLYDRDYTSYGLDLWSLMGAGAWLDDGNSPSHLDAWSKVRLGFVEPVVLDHNVEDVTLPPVEASPAVYKLWKNGTEGKEYFLLENREKTGFDFPLPGNGLLIYHVDETVKDNDNELRYMVALDQADGDFDLEKRLAGKQYGADAGDPFPGWSNNRTFGALTTPNSLSNDGEDVEVRVTNISLNGLNVSFDGTVETGPEPVITRVLTDDTGTGDGDGNPDAGETATLYLEVTNIGLASGKLTAVASCANTYVHLLSDTVKYDFLAADETRLPDEGFLFRVDTSLTKDPFRVYFVIDMNDGAFFDRRKSVVVGVGDSLGIADDFESGQGDWTHDGVLDIDEWHLSTRRAFSGTSSWHCGAEDSLTYANYQDSFLRTPFLISGTGSRLTFYQWLDVENENSRLAWDGCVVEVSIDNVTWEPVEPVGGYSRTIDWIANTEGAGRGCFSGRSKQWENVEFDLGRYSGALWVRFRIITDGAVSGEGWYVDDVRVTTGDEPYTISFVNVTTSPGRAEISWRVDPRLSIYNGQGMSLFRAGGESELESPSSEVSFGDPRGARRQMRVNGNLYTLVYQDPSRAIGLHSFVDTSVVSGEYYSYLIADVTASGAVNWISGPRVYVPYATHSVALAPCSPNPYVPNQGTLDVAFDIPGGTEAPVAKKVRVAVFDVAGRMIAVLFDGRALSGNHSASWDGKDSNGIAVAGGIYVISLEAGDTRLSRKIVLLR